MDQSQFDGNAAPARTRTSGFLVALIVGLIVGGGLMALWEIYGSAPVKQPKADIAAIASNETAQAIKDSGYATKHRWTARAKDCRPASVPPTNSRIGAGRDQAIV